MTQVSDMQSQSQNQKQPPPNSLAAMMQNQKKKAPSKLKMGKTSMILKDHKVKVADPCLSFGCQCTVCKSHLTKMRRGGDVSAIKAFQDEVNFRTFAAHT